MARRGKQAVTVRLRCGDVHAGCAASHTHVQKRRGAVARACAWEQGIPPAATWQAPRRRPGWGGCDAAQACMASDAPALPRPAPPWRTLYRDTSHHCCQCRRWRRQSFACAPLQHSRAASHFAVKHVAPPPRAWSSFCVKLRACRNQLGTACTPHRACI